MVIMFFFAGRIVIHYTVVVVALAGLRDVDA